MILVNNYLQIEPVSHEEFMASTKGAYDEVGKVLAVAEGITIPVGATVRFDSFMAKKFPSQTEKDKFDWFIAQEEIVAYE